MKIRIVALILRIIESLIKNKLIRFICLVIFAPLLGILLCGIFRQCFSDCIECFLIAGDTKIVEYISTVLLGVPVFIFIWFFRTYDTREAIEISQRQILYSLEPIFQSEFFNALNLLTSVDPLKIEIAVQQLIRISETNKKYDKDIRLAFVKRLKQCPIDINWKDGLKKEFEETIRLTYAQWILKWLADNYQPNDDLNNCNFNFQDFKIAEFKEEITPFHKLFKNKTDEKNEINFNNLSFVYADLTSVNLSNLDFKKINLTNSHLADADITNTNLQGAFWFIHSRYQREMNINQKDRDKYIFFKIIFESYYSFQWAVIDLNQIEANNQTVLDKIKSQSKKDKISLFEFFNVCLKCFTDNKLKLSESNMDSIFFKVDTERYEILKKYDKSPIFDTVDRYKLRFPFFVDRIIRDSTSIEDVKDYINSLF